MKEILISEPKHMYWDDELKNPKQCPKCNCQLKKEQHPFFVVILDRSEKIPFIIGCNGNFCKNCPIIILEKNEFGDMIHSYINKKSFGIHVAGIIDINKIPEDKRDIPLEEIDPLPVVCFINYENKKEHENFIKDKSVFRTKEDYYPIEQKKKIGRNEQCHCGSGKKYKNIV